LSYYSSLSTVSSSATNEAAAKGKPASIWPEWNEADVHAEKWVGISSLIAMLTLWLPASRMCVAQYAAVAYLPRELSLSSLPL